VQSIHGACYINNDRVAGEPKKGCIMYEQNVLTSELCQNVGDELFFTWHIFVEVGKTQDLPNKIC
jgi:hypothetical protein